MSHNEGVDEEQENLGEDSWEWEKVAEEDSESSGDELLEIQDNGQGDPIFSRKELDQRKLLKLLNGAIQGKLDENKVADRSKAE